MLNLIKTESNTCAFIARVSRGTVMLPHGLQKLFGFWGGQGFTTTLADFHETGLPYLVAFLIILAESLGALFLIAGFLSRISALFILAIMIGAIFKVHVKFGIFMNWSDQQTGEGIEYHLLVSALCAIVLIAGGGKWSVDGLIDPKMS